jgi:hypothetical protein
MAEYVRLYRLHRFRRTMVRMRAGPKLSIDLDVGNGHKMRATRIITDEVAHLLYLAFFLEHRRESYCPRRHQKIAFMGRASISAGYYCEMNGVVMLFSNPP